MLRRARPAAPEVTSADHAAREVTGFPARRDVARRARVLAARHPLGIVGLALVAVLVLVGVAAPILAPYGVNEFAGAPNQGPGGGTWFGTDRLGQDILSRVVHGARISLLISFLAVLGGSALGTVLGAYSGYHGGRIDTAIQRAVDTAIAFPMLVLLLVMMRLFDPSLRAVIIVIGIVIVPGVARVVRGAALAERNEQYVEAGRALGASDTRILLRHLLPNLAPLAIVLSTTLFGTAIVAEASLSFLGLGVPPPNPSWGADISAAREAFPVNAWAALFPGLAITLTVLGFNLLGDALRDALDPRLRA